MHRGATNKTTAGFKVSALHSKDFIDDTEGEVQRRVRDVDLGLQHQTQWAAAQIETGLNFKRGTGAFGAHVAPEDAFGEVTHRFGVWPAAVQWRQPVELAAQRWRYQGRWREHSNRTPLTPQDRLAIGGSYQFFAGLDHGEEGGPSAQNLLVTRPASMALRLRGGDDHLQYEVLVGRQLPKPAGFATAKATYGMNVSAQF